MGEAKHQGTQTERLAQTVKAKRKVAEVLGLEQRKLSETREELDLPQNAPFHGYVVHVPASDEVLAGSKDGRHDVQKMDKKTKIRATF